MLHTTQRVLIEGVSRKDAAELAGRTENNRIVNFPGDASLIGRFVEVKVVDVFRHSLRGELLR